MTANREDRVTGARVIRTVLPAEAEAVAALHLRARSTYYPDGLPPSDQDWVTAWRGALARPDAHVLCAVEAGALVAVASFRRAEGAPAGSVHLHQFHVDPGHWRAGIGRALHAACVEQWRADGVRTAGLSVHTGNQRAQAFYARLGWVPDPAHPPAEDDHHLLLTYDVDRGMRQAA